MRILVVAATEFEVAGLITEFGIPSRQLSGSDFFGSPEQADPGLQTFDFSLLITGVGMVATAFALGKHLAVNNYDLVLNLGIAGSFDRDISIGNLLEISEDTFAELGAEDDDGFLSIEKIGFGKGTYYPSTKLADLYNLFNTFNLKQAKAITVNTVHGNELSIAKVSARLSPQLESMEGAACFYACREMNMPCLQIRAVSNYVEKRNRDNWQVALAIKNLNIFAIEFLKLYA